MKQINNITEGIAKLQKKLKPTKAIGNKKAPNFFFKEASVEISLCYLAGSNNQ